MELRQSALLQVKVEIAGVGRETTRWSSTDTPLIPTGSGPGAHVPLSIVCCIVQQGINPDEAGLNFFFVVVAHPYPDARIRPKVCLSILLFFFSTIPKECCKSSCVSCVGQFYLGAFGVGGTTARPAFCTVCEPITDGLDGTAYQPGLMIYPFHWFIAYRGTPTSRLASSISTGAVSWNPRLYYIESGLIVEPSWGIEIHHQWLHHSISAFRLFRFFQSCYSFRYLFAILFPTMKHRRLR